MNIALMSRVAPFGLYMAFIALEELLQFLYKHGLLAITNKEMLFVYPLKIVSVALLLLLLRRNYTELIFREVLNLRYLVISLVVGVIVFAFWIRLDFPGVTMGTLRGFDPTVITDTTLRNILIISRLFGAVLVVPVMEELFWRSFIIRYIVNPDFCKIPIGFFTWPSFVVTIVLFGVEHNLFLAGMLAGVAYNGLLYYTRSISACVVAHGLTNLLLGVYVLQTGKWYFW